MSPPSLFFFPPPLSAGVRKHARKTHLDWLKCVDEGAGNRDRQFESKPSTYCVKEEGPFEAGDCELDCDGSSPPLLSVSPGLAPAMGQMSMCDPGDFTMLPPPIMEPVHMGTGFAPSDAQRAAAREMSGAMAAAAAACLVGQGGPTPPLAWLLAQSAAAAAANGNAQNPMAQQINAQMAQMAALAALQNHSLANMHGLAAGSAPQMAQSLGAMPRVPTSAPPPMPPANNWPTTAPIEPPPPATPAAPTIMSVNTAAPPPTMLRVNTASAVPSQTPSPLSLGFPDLTPPSDADLNTLFGLATGDADDTSLRSSYDSAAFDDGSADHAAYPAQPLCLTPPTTAATPSAPAGVVSSACMSPFELDKRPKNQSAASSNPSPVPTVSSENLENVKPSDDGQPDDYLTSKQESDYNAFVNTLLAV